MRSWFGEHSALLQIFEISWGLWCVLVANKHCVHDRWGRRQTGISDRQPFILNLDNYNVKELIFTFKIPETSNIFYTLSHKWSVFDNVLPPITSLPADFAFCASFLGMLSLPCLCVSHERCSSWSQLPARFMTVSTVVMVPITQQR